MQRAIMAHIDAYDRQIYLNSCHSYRFIDIDGVTNLLKSIDLLHHNVIISYPYRRILTS